MAWTQFWDMHSGGGTKESPYEYIYIEAPEEEAKIIFYNRFGHDPERVSCTCCGEDYSISESETLESATAYHRGCHFSDNDEGYVEEPAHGKWDDYRGKNYQTLDDYLKTARDVLVIRSEGIKEEERSGDIPATGWVWAG